MAIDCIIYWAVGSTFVHRTMEGKVNLDRLPLFAAKFYAPYTM